MGKSTAADSKCFFPLNIHCHPLSHFQRYSGFKISHIEAGPGNRPKRSKLCFSFAKNCTELFLAGHNLWLWPAETPQRIQQPFFFGGELGKGHRSLLCISALEHPKNSVLCNSAAIFHAKWPGETCFASLARPLKNTFWGYSCCTIASSLVICLSKSRTFPTVYGFSLVNHPFKYILINLNQILDIILDINQS